MAERSLAAPEPKPGCLLRAGDGSLGEDTSAIKETGENLCGRNIFLFLRLGPATERCESEEIERTMRTNKK